MKNTIIVLRGFLFVLMIPLFFNHIKATPLTATIASHKNISCNGQNNGTATATATGGTSPYTYVWSTNPTQLGVTATGLSAGTYTVVVADANFTTASVNVTITQPTPLIDTAFVYANVGCNGGYGGALGSTVSGGISPYTYLWSPSGITNSNATGAISAGCYTVTVTDANGCTETSSACITQPAAISINQFTTPDSNCASANGTATIIPSGGTFPYTYRWTPTGQTTASATGLSAGAYTCALKDLHGCSLTVTSIIVDSGANKFDQQICIVTLDTATNKCEIIWGRTNSPPAGGYGHFNIYRDSNNTYILDHSQALNVLSEYIDPNSNPSAGAVSYKLSTVDSCGESALSPVHTSIYLTATAGHNVYILNWTAYVGFTPSKYIIYRGPSLSKLTAIDSVANNILTYHDTLPPLGSYYVVEAENPNGPCVPTTHRPGKPSFSLLSGAFSNGFNTAKLLGINNLENNITNLNVYPNPSNGMFTLNYTVTGSDNVAVSIINELGQEVYTEQKSMSSGPHTEQLNIGNLASGIYSLRVQTYTGTSVRKLLIMQIK